MQITRSGYPDYVSPVRLAPHVAEGGAHIHLHVRHIRLHLAEVAQIVGVLTHVGGNEGRVRIFR
jgi:hypothetical protein